MQRLHPRIFAVLCALGCVWLGAVSLPADGAPAPATVSPASINFGSIHLGVTKTSYITVKLGGGYVLESVTGTGTTGDFSVGAPSSDCHTQGSQLCTLKQSWTPTAIGATTAQTLIKACTTVHTACGTYTVKLSGTGVTPVAQSATTLAFGNVALGVTKPLAMTLRLDAGWYVEDFFPSDGGIFDIANVGSNCLLTGPGNCNFSVTYSPTDVVKDVGIVQYEVCPTSGAQCVIRQIAVNGTGTAPAKVSVTSIAFGAHALKSDTPKPVTVQLYGRYHVEDISFPGGTDDDFTVADENVYCGPNGPGTCAFDIVYHALNPGENVSSAAIRVCPPSNISCFTYSIKLTGSATTPGSVSPSSVAFGNVKVGATSPVKTIKVTVNNGWQVNDLQFRGFGDHPVSINPDPVSCSSTATARTCTYNATFTPTALGAISDPMVPVVCPGGVVGECVDLKPITFTGTGTAPATASPTTLAFGKVGLGSSVAKTVAVKLDPGWYVDWAEFTGSGFSGEPIGCSGTGGTCTVNVGFLPEESRAYAETLRIGVCQQSSSTCVALTVKLTGTGTPPTARTAARRSTVPASIWRKR